MEEEGAQIETNQIVDTRRGSQGVVISSPSNGATLTSPVALKASLSTAAIFQVFDNGTSIYRTSQRVTSINVPLTLVDGKHTLKVQASTSGIHGYTYISSVAIVVKTPVDPPVDPPPSTSLAADLAADMHGGNEAYPQGVPTYYDWCTGPVMVMGNDPNGWRALTAWGLVYPAANGNPATNTRVNIRHMQSWLLSKSKGTWTQLQSTDKPDGSSYLADFSGDAWKTADIRNETDGSISVTVDSGWNFHFYPSARGSINPNDVGGIVTIFEARLIVGNPKLPDDRATAAYLCGSGGDYYPALTGGWPANLGDANPGIAGGKLKYVHIPWRFFSMTTMTQAQLEQNPPPIDMTGILP